MFLKYFILRPVAALAIVAIVGLYKPAAAQILYATTNPFNGITSTGMISGVSADGSVTSFVTSGLGASTYGLAFNNSGSLFVSVTTSNSYLIDEVSLSGDVSNFINAGNFGLTPTYMAFGPNGNLYVSNYTFMSPGYISEITPSGTVFTFTSALTDGANGIAFDSNGNLFVASGNQTIYKVTPDGTTSVFASNLNGAIALAFDQSGNLYTVSNSSIIKLAPDGTSSTFVSGGFNQSFALKFDSQGNLFVLNDSTISEVTPDGTVSTFATGLSNPFDLAFSPSPIPEPSTWSLLVTGIIGSLLIESVKRRKEAALTSMVA